MLASQRHLFEMPRQICYLNSASYSPLPLRTLEAGRAAVERKGRPWALEAGFAGSQLSEARRPGRVREWFTTWAELGWICAPALENLCA